MINKLTLNGMYIFIWLFNFEENRRSSITKQIINPSTFVYKAKKKNTFSFLLPYRPQFFGADPKLF